VRRLSSSEWQALADDRLYLTGIDAIFAKHKFVGVTDTTTHALIQYETKLYMIHYGHFAWVCIGRRSGGEKLTSLFVQARAVLPVRPASVRGLRVRDSRTRPGYPRTAEDRSRRGGRTGGSGTGPRRYHRGVGLYKPSYRESSN
jgi:hypothetical protein